MKTFVLTIDEKEAEAIGYALKAATRDIETRKDYKTDPYWKEFHGTLKRAYENLDTCPEVQP